MSDSKCTRPGCESPAEYVFVLDGSDSGDLDEDLILVFRCPPCLALDITQGWLMASEIHTLERL